MYQTDKRYSEALCGREINQELLEETIAAYRKIPYTKELQYSMNYPAAVSAISASLGLARGKGHANEVWQGRQDTRPVHPGASQGTYAARRGTVWEMPVVLGGIYGMRSSEILGLRWRNVDLENNTFEVSEQLPVAKPDGAPVSASWVSSQFGKLLKDLGMPHIRFHDLRHTAAANMHQLTDDFYTVGEVLGHTLAGIGTIWAPYKEKAPQKQAIKKTPITHKNIVFMRVSGVF